MSHSWGYGSDNGPETWWKHFPAAAGTKQSPVDITPVDLQTLNVKKLTWIYVPENSKTLSNNGHSWVVHVDGKSSAFQKEQVKPHCSKCNPAKPSSCMVCGNKKTCSAESMNKGSKKGDEEIEESYCDYKDALESFEITPEEAKKWSICDPEYSGQELSGGPLDSRFVLEQFHCHWGATDDVGSEHTVEGRKFAGELHLVHWNTRYSSFAEAAKHPDGLCVLGVFLTPGKENSEIAKLVSKFEDIQHKGQSVNISTPLDINRLIPEDSTYWTYQGSLTTPPCSECVIWIVFREPIEVSRKQLNIFRTLKTYSLEDDKCPENEEEMYVKNNFRPTVPLGKRTIGICKP